MEFKIQEKKEEVNIQEFKVQVMTKYDVENEEQKVRISAMNHSCNICNQSQDSMTNFDSLQEYKLEDGDHREEEEEEVNVLGEENEVELEIGDEDEIEDGAEEIASELIVSFSEDDEEEVNEEVKENKDDSR
jgi:hypothetical protein